MMYPRDHSQHEGIEKLLSAIYESGKDKGQTHRIYTIAYGTGSGITDDIPRITEPRFYNFDVWETLDQTARELVTAYGQRRFDDGWQEGIDIANREDEESEWPEAYEEGNDNAR